MKERRVVITGMGVIAPGAKGVDAFRDMLENGRSGITKQPMLEELNFGCHVGGVVDIKEEEEDAYYNYFELPITSQFIKYACVAGVEAWKDAGLSIPDPKSEEIDWDTVIIIGTSAAGIDTYVNKFVPLTQQGKVKRIGSYGVQLVMPSGPSAYLSWILGTGGQAYSNSSACCTGTEAMLEGFQKIKMGQAKRALVGGTELSSPYLWAGFDTLKALNSSSNDAPEKASRPMSASARGFVPGSGAGILLIEDLETALERGATIHAEILGGNVNCGAQRGAGTMTFPNNTAVIRSITSAIESSEVQLDEIGLINGHLTGTKADPIEIANWKKVFGDRFPMINSTKSMIGHGLGAAGSIETVATVLQLKHGVVHPSINCEDVHPEIEKIIDSSCIPHTKTEMPDLKVAIKASFGFGDVNATALLRKWDEN